MLQDKSTFIQEVEEEEYDNQYYVHETIHVLDAQQEPQKPREKTPEELVPVEYHKFLKVFSKRESKQMPLWTPWDHTIDLKDVFKPKKGRIIPLSLQEQEEVTTFVISQTLPESTRYSRVIPKSFLYDPRVIPEFPELNPSWSTYLLIPEYCVFPRV